MARQARQRPLALQIAILAFLVVWLIAASFPFLWTMWGSFKVELDFFSIAVTGAGYYGAWVQEAFWANTFNTAIVCFFVVCTSLTIGTLGGYALSRSSYNYAFWLLIIALIFRAMPPITLVAGYLLPFVLHQDPEGP